MKKFVFLLSFVISSMTISLAQTDLSVYAGYSSLTLKAFSISMDASGFVAGVQMSNPLPKVENLKLIYGGELNFNNYEGEKFMSIAIPVNIGYEYSVSDEVSIVPYAGLNFKVNVMDKEDGYNVFGAKRFQLGANIGVNLNYKNIYIGYRFTPDFIPYYKETYSTDDIWYDDDPSDFDVKVKSHRNIVYIGFKF